MLLEGGRATREVDWAAARALRTASAEGGLQQQTQAQCGRLLLKERGGRAHVSALLLELAPLSLGCGEGRWGQQEHDCISVTARDVVWRSRCEREEPEKAP